jgi:AMMECR1 domain-containing protein
MRDPRFPSVTPSELPDLEIHISVLTPPRPLPVSGPDELRERLQPFVHGVTIQNGMLRALYLPQVWDHFAGDADIIASFLGSLSRKAGDMSGTLWRQQGTRFEVFEAISFGEGDTPG